MAKTKDERLAEVHGRMKRRFDACWSASKDERAQAMEDRRFYSIAGAQWEGDVGVQFKNKLRLEVNKVHLAVIRIENEYRNNRVSVDFVSKTGEADDELADVCDSLFRADEQDSVAEEAYDNAFQEAIGGGMGAWRLVAEMEDEGDPDNECQRIRFAPIYDADATVFFDPNARRQSKTDAGHAFVLQQYTRDAYKDEYGDNPATWETPTFKSAYDWATIDQVTVAEYYEVEKAKEVRYTFRDVNGEEEDFTDADVEETPTLFDDLRAIGSKMVKKRTIQTRRVHKYIANGARIIEDCGYIAGKYIPIVPCYGKRWVVNGIERFMGHVRLTKDAQRLKNMQLSKLGEIAALSPVEKPILYAEQIVGHEQRWANDTIENYPVLLINPITGQDGSPLPPTPIEYTRSPNIPPAMAALLQLTEQDMQDLLGNQQQADKVVSNIGHKTVEAVQERLDMQTFIYMSNFAKAEQTSAEIWLSMAADLYVEEGRTMKAIGPQGEIQSVTLRRLVKSEKDGGIEYQNDIAAGKFDVVATVGPSSVTRRSKTVRELQQILAVTQDPETAQVLQAMILANMDGEGIGDMRKYFRAKLVRMGVLTPTEEEKKQMEAEKANQQPDAQTKYYEAAANQANAEAIQANANTVLKVQQAQKAAADTHKVISETHGIEQRHALEAINAIDALGNRPTPPPTQPTMG